MEQWEGINVKKEFEMILSKRLGSVASYVAKGNTAADIGCDHAFVPVSLVRDGICPRAIAADVREGPLMRAEEHIRAAGLSHRIQTRLSDGLDGILPGEAQSIIISGMGGMLLIRILSRGEAAAKAADELILSPQSDLYAVRRYLVQNGYTIKEESVVREDGKYYFIFYVLPEKDTDPWEEAEYHFGKRIRTECLNTAAEACSHGIARDGIRKKILAKASVPLKSQKKAEELYRRIQMAEDRLREIKR